MLFLVKRTAGLALLVALALAATGFGLRAALGLDRPGARGAAGEPSAVLDAASASSSSVHLPPGRTGEPSAALDGGSALARSLAARPAALRAALRAALGLAAIAASDGLLHVALALACGRRYLRRFAALADLFDGQRAGAVLAGGALASAEEVFFRGVVLEGLRAPLGPAPALAVASVLFGLAHAVPRPGFAGFTLWSIWEGALLGAVYLASGSLAWTALAHGVHDVLGFALLGAVRALRAAPALPAIMPRGLAGRLLPLGPDDDPPPAPGKP